MPARTSLIAAIAIAVVGVGPAIASSHGNALVHSREFGGQVYMMNQQHMSLYYYESDTPNVSNCYDACAVDWPPALLDAGVELGENYSLIERTDGTLQAAFMGQPLYRFKDDRKPGDIGGDGAGGVWRLARP